MRPSIRIYLTALLLLGIQRQTFAHAFLDKAEPKVGQQIATSPTQVKIWLSEDVQEKKCLIVVRDSAGKQVDLGDTHADAANPALLIVSVSKLPPGTYNVTWNAVSVDTHHTQGSFKFEIK